MESGGCTRRGRGGANLGLVQVGVCGRNVDEHEGLGGAPQRIGHEHCQLVVAVRDVALLAGQGRDDVTQGTQRLVDGLSLLQLLTGGARFLHPAKTDQI
jgi:hypothetical protein